MHDTIMVNQPTNQNLHNNETIVEVTGEDESQIIPRFSQQFKDEEDSLQQCRPSQLFKEDSYEDRASNIVSAIDP